MFNISKIINNIFGMEKTAARESDLASERNKQGLSSGEDVGESALSVDRTNKEAPVIEASLQEIHDGDGDDSTIEASIEKYKGIVARQPEKTDDYGDVHPMAVASESWDAKARVLYKKELDKMSSEKSLLDKYMGNRHITDTKIDAISASDSGIANNPDRFTSFGSSPVVDVKDNLDSMDKPAKINKLASNVMDIDAMRFAVEFDAARRGYHTKEEKTALNRMRMEKKQLLLEMHSV